MLYTVNELNNILQGLVGNVKIFGGYHKDSKEVYYYMVNIDNSKDAFGIASLVEAGDLDGLISEASKLKIKEFIKIEIICTDLIGKKVWVDKEIPITISEINISTGNSTVISTKGRTYSTDNLWIENNGY